MCAWWGGSDSDSSGEEYDFRRDTCPTYIYHYTNQRGYSGIKRDMRIKSYARDTKHARLGVGVYFIDLKPESSTDAILHDCYHHTKFKDKSRYYVRIRKSDVKFVTHGRRNIYCVLGEDGIDLNKVPHEFGQR